MEKLKLVVTQVTDVSKQAGRLLIPVSVLLLSLEIVLGLNLFNIVGNLVGFLAKIGLAENGYKIIIAIGAFYYLFVKK